MEAPFPPFDPDGERPASSGRVRDIPIKAIFPNLLTLLAICLGLTAIRFATEQRFEPAIAAIILAAILDGLDGRVARFLKSVSRFGAQMDSLADFVNFGVAPAMLLYHWTLADANSLGWIATLIYVICVCLRLARFNVMLDQPGQPKWQKDFFVGVPAPAGAMIVLLPVYLGFIGAYWLRAHPYPIAVYTLAVAFLVISSLPTWAGKEIGRRIRRDLVLPLMIAAVLFVAVLLSYPWKTLAAVTAAYLAGLPLGYLYWRRLAERHSEPAPRGGSAARKEQSE